MRLIAAAVIALAAAAWGFFMIQNRNSPEFLAKFSPKASPEDYPAQTKKVLIQGSICILVGLVVLAITVMRYYKGGS